jgi:hypothetical protein
VLSKQAGRVTYGLTIDYRREDGHFPVSVSCVTISNPDLLSRSETGVDPGIMCDAFSYEIIKNGFGNEIMCASGKKNKKHSSESLNLKEALI